MKLAGTEPLLVLIDGCDLVVRDHFLQHLTVDVVALQGLARLSATEDITTRLEQFVDGSNARGVLVVAESIAQLDFLSASD